MEMSLDQVDHENETSIGQFSSLDEVRGENASGESWVSISRMQGSELEGRHAWP